VQFHFISTSNLPHSHHLIPHLHRNRVRKMSVAIQPARAQVVLTRWNTILGVSLPTVIWCNLEAESRLSLCLEWHRTWCEWMLKKTLRGEKARCPCPSTPVSLVYWLISCSLSTFLGQKGEPVICYTKTSWKISSGNFTAERMWKCSQYDCISPNFCSEKKSLIFLFQ
jgi:hypothetical protein